MARLGTAFNAQDHDTTQSDYSELPNGIYRLEIEASDVVPTKAGDGTILKTTFAVMEPEELKGRKLFGSYNLENKSPQAQEIGQKQFASLCRAIGESTVEDSEDLHFRGFVAKVGLGKPSKDGQYPARAEIKAYYFPDDDKDMPEPAVDKEQPAARAPAANDNKPAARPAAAAAERPKTPWGVKKAA